MIGAKMQEFTAISAEFRKPFTTQQAHERGISHSALKWAVKQGAIQRVAHGIYVEGDRPPSPLEQAVATVVRAGGVANGLVAATLYGLDGITPFSAESRDHGIPCTGGLETMLDLAAQVDDIVWEQALESALRKELTTIDEIVNALKQQRKGNMRIKRVLKLRPLDAPPTESLLETLMVQLIRACKQLPEPTRQLKVFNKYGEIVGRPDLSWPEHGVFIELDGQQHKGQPIYDARRETAIVAVAGWLPARFTWTEVTKIPKTTGRRVVEILEIRGFLED